MATKEEEMKHEDEYMTIGKFYLEWNSEGKIWIEIGDGLGLSEGGEFNESELEAAIEKLYSEKF
jgi:hypothetical protein